MTLELADFPHHRPKVRARTGGLYHPIVHMHPADMRALDLACGGLACVIAAEGAMGQGAARPPKQVMGVASKNAVHTAGANGPAVVAIAGLKPGASAGRRLSRLAPMLCTVNLSNATMVSSE